MRSNPLPDQTTLLQLLRYEPDSGKLYWRERPRQFFTAERAFNTWNARFSGKEAFTAQMAGGYRVGGINDALYYAHRVIVKMIDGVDPDEVDHINGDRSDNRKSNLRAVSRLQNSMNIRRKSNNTSGCTGVCWAARERKWRVRIFVCGKAIYLGDYTSKTEAIAVRKSAELTHGYHQNHDRVSALRAS